MVKAAPTTEALRHGDAVPHFVLRGHDGTAVDYVATIWQRRSLVFVAVTSTHRHKPYVDELTRRTASFNEHESTVVITQDRIRGLPAPGLLIADRWGEIVHIVTPKVLTDLPCVSTLLQWVEAVEHRCPECEGEAK